MSMIDTNDSQLVDLHEEIYQRALGDPYFATLALMRADKGQLLSDIAVALSTLTKVGGKIGSAVVFFSPVASLESNNVPGSPMRPRLTIRVLEDPLFNLGASGTGKPALQTAMHIVALFHLFTATGLCNPLNTDEPCIVPVEDPVAPVAYEVRFNTTTIRQTPYRKVAMQKIVSAGTVVPQSVTFQVDPVDAAVWITTDGLYPRPAVGPNAAQGALWDGSPLAVSAAQVLRAAAYKDGYIQSDVLRQDFTA